MHSIQAEIEFTRPDGEVFYPKIDIAYTYIPGSPAVMYQRNGDPGWPAEAPEIEVISSVLTDDDNMEYEPTAKELMQWADEWIHDTGFYNACEEAEAYGE